MRQSEWRSGDFGNREDRRRVPTKGIRTRLRTLLKKMGVTFKYRTDEKRDGTLLVMCREEVILPITEFEGRKVKSYIRE